VMLNAVNVNRLVEQFLEFVQIDSPSFEETAFIARLRAELEALGLKAESDGTGRNGAGNVLAVLPGNQEGIEPIMISLHVDTVEPGRGIRPRIEDGIIRSDGTTVLGADNKSAVAATLEAVRCLQASRLAHGDVELLFSWGEEHGLHGARAFDTSRLRSRFGFAPDGGGTLGTIVTRAPYHDTLIAEFRGRAAHAGVEPEKGISALAAAARAINRMPLGRIDAETTANLGLISGGTARNAVPEHVRVEGEARSLDRAKLERQIRLMRIALQSAARETGAEVEVKIEREYDGYTIGEDESPVRLAQAAALALGIEPRLAATGGGSDANIFNAAGLRTVVLGMGGHAFHSTQEHIAVADLGRLAALIGQIIVEAGRKR
jgi:tripeptide aminopeptidase